MNKSRIKDTQAWALASDGRRWWRKWRHHQAGYELHDRALVHYRVARQKAFARWPLHGNVAELLATGRLVLGEDAVIASQVSLLGVGEGRISIGQATFVGIGAQISAVDAVEIGDHCQIAFGCFISDFDHRYDDHGATLVEQGLVSKGPTRIGDHVWLGAHAVVTSGVTIGERSVIGANAVVTKDVPPGSVVVGVPGRVVKTLAERPDTSGPPLRFERRETLDTAAGGSRR